jgi:hypothetical protein
MDKRLERQARNEALLREVNERIDAVDKASTSWDKDGLFEFVCECGEGCDVNVGVTLTEYERVRAQSDRFLLTPGHENERLEHIVERTERYVIVDKVPDAEPFVEDDPRGAPSH